MVNPAQSISRLMKLVLVLMVLMVGKVEVGWGQVNIAVGSTYTQDFNTLSTTSATWTDNSTLAGWYVSTVALPIQTGATNANSAYNCGTSGSGLLTDRAIGALSSSTSHRFGVRLFNNGSTNITSFNINFTGEQWRSFNAGTLVFEYQTAATVSSLTAVGTWTAFTSLDFASLTTSSGAATDGNNASFRTAKSATLTVTVAPSTEIFFRWSKSGTSSACLAADDISITANGTTAPEINIKQSATNIATAGTYAFGNQISGTSSSATTFTIENTGNAALNLTGTPKIAISGTNASEFTIDQTATTATVAAAGTTTFTITFSPTSQGAKTAAISIANDDATGAENPYVINLTGTGTVSAASDITNKSGYVYTSNVDYSSYQSASTLTAGNSVGVNGFTIRDGGATTDADNLGTTLNAITVSTGGSTAIRTAALFDGTTNVKEVSVNGATSFSFTGLALTAADGSTKDFELRVTYQSTVTDNQQITFTVSSATAASTGSNFAAANAGAAASSTTGDNNRIEVTATILNYSQQPPSTLSAMAVMTPAVALVAQDANSNTDLDYTASVSMTVTTGSTTFDGSATTTASFTSGAVSFSNLVFNTAATANKITATSGSLSKESSAFDVTTALPEINIKQGATTYLTAGTYAFGSIVSGASSSVTTFTIENLGTAILNLTGTPKVAISGTNAAEFTINETSTTATVAAAGNTTFTITFSPTSQGAKTAAISIANDDVTGSENPYVINLTGTGTVSAASDITNTAGYSYISNVAYVSYQTPTTLTTGNSVGVNGLTIRDGAATTDADNLGTSLTAITFSTGGSTAIRTAALFDGTTNVKEVAVNGATSIAFTGLTLTATDGSTKDFELRVTYQSTVTDNQQITFTVSAATAATTGSNFAAANAGAAASTATGDINRIEVTISQLVFTQQPSNVNTGVSMTPAVTVAGKDANNNTDLDFIDNVRVSSSGTMTGSPVSVAAVSGVATFSTLTHTVGGTGLTLLAERDNGGAWDLDLTSNAFDVTAVSASTDYFRSKVTGNWGSAASWESSSDGASNWITATLTPTSAANTITIENGHTISIVAVVTIDQVVVKSGGILTLASGGAATIANGASGDDIIIQNGGRVNYQLAPIYNASATIRVNGGGILSVEVSGLTGAAAGVNASTHIYDDASILQYNITSTPSSGNVTFFPNVTTEVPILRFASSVTGWGAGTPTTVNGKLDISSGIAVGLASAGVKTFKYGIIGAGNLNQSTAGQIIISGNSGELGGSGIITLGTNGLTISAGTTTLSSNKQIDGNTLSITGTLVTGTYQLSGSSAVTVNNLGTLKLGSTSVSGAVLGNIPYVTPTFSIGSTVEFNGAAAQYIAAKTYSNLTINNTGGVTALADLTINLVLNLSSLNPSATKGTLEMSTYTLNMAAAATTTGTGDVTGIVTRTQTFTQNTAYSFGNQFCSLNFTAGTKPTTVSVKLVLTTIHAWNTTAIHRYYDVIQSGADGTSRVTFRAHYLDGEFNGNTETLLDFYDYHVSGPAGHDHGHSGSSTVDKWVELANLSVNYFAPASFGSKYWTLANSGVLAFIWTGNSSSVWTEPLNWTGGVAPDGTSNVIIPSTTAMVNQPTLPATTSINQIDIESGGVLNGGTATSLTLNQSGTSSGSSWENDGTFNAGTSTIIMGSSTNSHSIAGTSVTSFYNLTVDNSTGVYLGANETVTGTLSLTTGNLFVGAHTLTLSGPYISGSVDNLKLGATSNLALNCTGSGPFTLPNFSTVNNLSINSSGKDYQLNSYPDINGALTLTAGSLDLNGFGIYAYGAVSGSGTIKGAATSTIDFRNGASGTFNMDQTNATTRSLFSLTLMNGANMTLNGALDIYDMVNLTDPGAVLHLNHSHLILKSTALSTARVTEIPGTSTLDGADNVTVERYIANPKRSWHMLSAIAVKSGTQTIKDAWQEGGSLNTGYGTLITSNLSTGSNGFDATSLSASMLTYNGTNAWLYSLDNTNTNLLSGHDAYMLYVRGDRNYAAATPGFSSTVLRSTGTLTQGGQASITVSSTPGNYTLVANPYASPIDMENVLSPVSNLDKSFHVWDPNLSGTYGVGGYRLVTRNSANNYSSTPVVTETANPDATAQYVPSGSAFFMTATGSDASFSIIETMKSALVSVVNPTPNIAGDQQLFVSMKVVNADGTSNLIDGIRVRYDAAYLADTTDDNKKLRNFGENISAYRENKEWIIEKRPMINVHDTIFLHTTGMGTRNYRFQIGTFDFVQQSLTAYLEDSFLGTVTPIQLDGSLNTVDFTVTGVAASSAADRFRIVFGAPSGPLPINFTSIKAYQQGVNVAVEWKLAAELGVKNYEIEKSTNGNNFNKVGTQLALANNGSDVTYNWLDVNPAAGNNFYRIRSIENSGMVKYSSIAKVNIGKLAPAITVYPNPVTGKQMSVQFIACDKGLYNIKLINNMGQSVYTSSINHTGGSATQSITLEGIAAGNYYLKVIKPDQSNLLLKVNIAN